MSVESEILRIQHNIASAYTKVSEKGGEVPLQPTSANLAAAIGTIAGGGSSGGVPVGTIVIWSGTAEDIPDGWALCDGQEGRPDLRDKFVLGAGTAHAVGATGGEETHTLTVEEMPAHRHTYSRSFSNIAYIDPASSAGTRVYKFDDSTISVASTGGSQPHNNMPPYYALCYIIKTTEDSGGSGSGGGNPIGTVISFMGTSAPKDYLVCDGSVYSISEYPKLAAFFAEQFGASNHFGGDGTTTIAVPDMRNLFLRGYHGEGEELSGEVGVRQEATENPYVTINSNQIYGFSKGSINSPENVDTELKTSSTVYFGGTNRGTFPAGSYSAAYTARPVNMAVLYCIKAVESTSGGGSGESTGEVYSTEETRIGTWTDGKPIYRKVSTISLKNNTNNQQFDIGLTDVDTVTNLRIIIKRSSTENGWVVSNYTNSSGTITCGIRLDYLLWVSVVNFSDVAGQPAYAIVEYTKTTD